MNDTEIEIISTDEFAEVEVVEADVEEMETENTLEEIENMIAQYEDSRADYTETLAVIQQNTDYLPTIAGDVRVLLVVAVLTFCWSCMRSWRVHVMGGRK